MTANDNARADELNSPGRARPMYVAQVGADDVINFLATLPPEEAARVRARAWTLRPVED